MSRSLVLAFTMAIIAHVLLAGLELDLFKEPLQVRHVPTTLTVDLIKPVEKRAPSKTEEPPTTVRKPQKKVIQKSITKKVETKPEPEPVKKKKTTKVPEQRPVPESKLPFKPQVPVYLPSPGVSGEKEEQPNPERKYAFIPDMVDIPTALPKREDVPQAEGEDRSPPRSPDEPTTLATPNYKKNSAPPYPLLARRRNYEGTVLLDVLVRMDGTVGQIRLARSSGHTSLDRSARKAVKQWRFHPGKRGDKAIEMWVTIPIRFQLR